MNERPAAATLLSFVLALGACGGPAASEPSAGAESEPTGGGEGASTSTTAAGPPRPWAEMSDEERGHYMADVVVPEMRAMFQEHDAERYAEFGCATCHGENAREVGFHMPNGLSPLDPAAVGGMFASSDPMHVFMTQRVWPRMGALLGESLYDPSTHEGFRCFDCHATAEPAATAMR